MALAKGEVRSAGSVREADGRQVFVGPGTASSGATAGALTANPSRPAEAKTAKGKITAETSSKELVAANESRVALFISNAGANPVWLAFGPTAVAEEGPMLVKEGGSVIIDNYSGKVAIITKTSTSVVGYSEI